MKIKDKLYTYPQADLDLLISDIIFENYHLVWICRPVLQNKLIRKSKLQNIDYTMPLFKLAKILKTDVNILGENIVTILQNKNVDYKYLFDINDGYLNIQLSDISLQGLYKNAAQWYEGTCTENNSDKKYVVYIPDSYMFRNSNSNSLYISFITIISNLHTILDSDFSVSQLTDDISDQDEHNESLILDNKLAAIATKHTNVFVGEDNQQTNNCLEQVLEKDTPESIFKDKNTGALFYSDKYVDIPLRSVSGRVYYFAYLLNDLNSIISHSKSEDYVYTILIPQKYHYALSNLLNILHGPSLIQMNIKLFDPLVSKANIVDIEKNNKDLGTHFRWAGELLNTSVLAGNLARDRKDLVFLASLPNEFNILINKYNLPSLFDYINHMYDILDKSELS